MRYLFLILLLSACASKPSKEEQYNVSDVKNEDFDVKSKLIKYNERSDYYTNELNATLATEGMMLFSEGQRDDFIKDDFLNKSLYQCHQREIAEPISNLLANATAYQKNPVFWNTIGVCYLKNLEYKKALMFFNKALDVEPKYIAALNNLGVLFVLEGNDQKAIVAFEKAVSSAPFAKTPKLNLSKIQLKYYLAEKAKSHLTALYSQNPKIADVAQTTAYMYLLLGDYNQANNIYKSLDSDLIERPGVGLNYVISLLMSGKREEAQDVFDDIELELNPSLTAFYNQVRGRL